MLDNELNLSSCPLRGYVLARSTRRFKILKSCATLFQPSQPPSLILIHTVVYWGTEWPAMHGNTALETSDSTLGFPHTVVDRVDIYSHVIRLVVIK